MKFLIALIFCTTISALLKAKIKRHPQIAYLVVLIITSFFSLPIYFFGNSNSLIYISKYFTVGYLSLAFFTIVMFLGAVNNNSKIIKNLLSIRSQLSIIATILLLPHLFSLLKISFYDLINIKLSLAFISSLISFALIILLIILFITSFSQIKKKFKDIRWKKIQKLSYPFYFLLYIHLIIVNIPHLKLGVRFSSLNIIIYSFIFYFYLMLKIKKEAQDFKTYFTFLSISIAITLLLSLFLLSQIFLTPPIPEQDEGPFYQNSSNMGEVYIQSSPMINKNNNSDLPEEELFEILNTKQKNIRDGNEFIILDPKPPLQDPNSIEPDEQINKEHHNEKYNDGIYTTSSTGYKGEIILKTVLYNDEITNVIIKYSMDNDTYFEKAFNTIRELILTNQTYDVDTVSGATRSSKGIIEAVKKALDLASIKK